MSDRIRRFTVGIRGAVASGLVAVALTACRSRSGRIRAGPAAADAASEGFP